MNKEVFYLYISIKHNCHQSSESFLKDYHIALNNPPYKFIGSVIHGKIQQGHNSLMCKAGDKREEDILR